LLDHCLIQIFSKYDDNKGMVSLWITIGLVIAALSVSSLGAFFSITGLGALFSGALVAVWLMAGSLEFSKFVMAAYLHQTWGHLNKVYRTYLVFAVVVLSVITSIGVFGFLSQAYQSASTVLEAENIKLQNIMTQKQLSEAEIARLNKSIDEIPANRITRRLKARAEIEPAIQELNKKVATAEREISAANLTILDVKKKVGPLIYIAKTFNMDIDVVVRYLILIFVSVFDPLAICLVIASTHAIESHRTGRFARYTRKQSMRVRVEEETVEEDLIVEEAAKPAEPAVTPAAAATLTVEPAAAAATAKPIAEPAAIVSHPEIPSDISEDIAEDRSDDIIVQMNFKDENEDKKAV
jgi:hypothetical protein